MTKFHVLGLGSIGAIIANSLQELQKTTSSLQIEVIPIIRNKSKVVDFGKNHDFKLKINQLYHKKTVISDPFELTTCPEMLNESKDTLTREPIENLVITTKTHQTVAALKPIWNERLINENTNIILIQNGFGMLEELITAFPEIASKNFKVFQGVISHGVFMENYPNEFNHAGFLDLKIAMINGMEDNGIKGLQTVQDLQKLKQENALISVFQHLNLDVKVLTFQELTVGQIEKFCVNCCINSITTILNCVNGQLLVNEVETRKLFTNVITEVTTLFAQSEKYKNIFNYYNVIENVANKENYPNTIDLTKLNNIPKLLDYVVDIGCVKNRENSSSMRQDAINKRDTEIDFINGYVVRLCLQELSLPVSHCSVNNTIVSFVKVKNQLLKETSNV
ncbi:hypothetical protein ACO0RG_000760 [Hanseniaspora osmophila]|uniref:2-dehydropantoate 2-reductase n=1 Tax=Hanseniaspora osmophila TaxID=56408 RepID=A0A1E5R2C5_9ASCO|nr:2-dehydropantoate 2-reductase [Hanseniaspora osmophila]